jgi:hypothetical protein
MAQLELSVKQAALTLGALRGTGLSLVRLG